MPENNKQERITQALMGLVATGFLAWSGVVWSAALGAKDIYIRLDTTLTAITERLERLEERFDRHEKLEAHPPAVVEMRALRRDLDGLSQRIERAHP